MTTAHSAASHCAECEHLRLNPPFHASVGDGGPAFPGTEAHGLNSGMPGMTIRDYFAAKVMQALAAEATPSHNTLFMNYEAAARESYLIADAMLKARSA